MSNWTPDEWMQLLAKEIRDDLQDIQSEMISAMALVDRLTDTAARVSMNPANIAIFENWPTSSVSDRVNRAIVELQDALHDYIGHFRGAA